MILKNIIFFIILFSFNIAFANNISENVTVRGFGTVGGSYNTNNDYKYRDNVLSNVGSKNDFSFATHSKLGLQVDLSMTDKLSSTVQGMTYQKEKGKLDFNLDWAYLKYQYNEQLNFKIGRMRVPFFIFSDSSNINYTNIWTHIPKETAIASIPIASYNGIETEWLTNISEHNLSLQAYYGEEKESVKYDEEGLEVKLKNTYGFSITDYYADLKLRAIFFKGDVDLNSTGLNELLKISENYGVTNLQNYYLNDLDFELYGLGFNYQINNIFLAGEYTIVELDNNFIDDMKGWYLSLGYQFNKVMPYITYGNSKQKVSYPIKDIYHPIPVIQENFRNEFSKSAEKFNYSQESISLGVRYDILKNMALKTQVDRIYHSHDKRTMHYFYGTEKTKGYIDVYSITLDFVF